MNIAMNHGYLLTGTGSNLYVRNLVKEFCAAGHNVYLLCQDFHPEHIDFVSDVYALDEDNRELQRLHHKDTPYPGTCHCFRPNLHGLLPVYVFDHYEGFEVKTFPDCTDAEIESYVAHNVAALSAVLERFPIDIIQTNHTVMLPYIVSRLPGLDKYRHFATVHGSALNFTVRSDDRFVPFAIQGLESADEIFVDSKHAHQELLEFLDENNLDALRQRIRVIPPGVDIDNFALSNEPKARQIERFGQEISSVAAAASGRGRAPAATQQILQRHVSGSRDDLREFVEGIKAGYDYRYIDPDVADKIQAIDMEKQRVVIFIGKYLWTKGLHLLMLAIPLILRKHPNTHFVFVGFGPFREAAELILAAMARGELDSLYELCRDCATPFHGDPGQPVPLLAEALQHHREAVSAAVSDFDGDVRDRVTFTGIITHDHLGYLLACGDILVAPSVFPEAFGMVAIEAMACGVYPILTYQSAFREITDELKEHLQVPQLSIRNVELDPDAIVNIAENAKSYLDVLADLEQRGESKAAVQKAMRDVVVASYSWQGVSKRFLARYAHHLELRQ